MECQLLGHLFDNKTIITKYLVSVRHDQEMLYEFYLEFLGECVIRDEVFPQFHILLSLNHLPSNKKTFCLHPLMFASSMHTCCILKFQNINNQTMM